MANLRFLKPITHIKTAVFVAVTSLALHTPVKAEQWHLKGTLEMAQDEVIGPITFSPMTDWGDGGHHIAASVWDQGSAYSAWLWSASNGLRLVEFQEIFPSLLELRFTPRETAIVSLSHHIFAHSERELRSWKISDGNLSARFQLNDQTRTLDAVFVKDHYLTTMEVGGVAMWSRDGVKTSIGELDALRPYEKATIVGDDKAFLTSGAFTLRLDLESFDPSTTSLGDAPGSFGPYEMFLAAAPSGQMIATYPEVGDDPLWTAPVPTVRVWHDVWTWTGDSTAEVEITDFDSPIRAAEFSRENSMILTVEDDGDVIIWQTRDGAKITQISARDDRLVSARFTPKGGGVVASHASGSATLYDAQTGAQIQTFPAPSSEITFSPDGVTMITSGIAKAPARIWRLTAN
ncbi:MAG: WD40 repeat domain-containing protein [Pseudomonadota bacterium]